MASRPSHAERFPSTAPPRPTLSSPKVQVQHSLSKDRVTIHFSALGKEEDDETLYGTTVSMTQNQPQIATAIEAKEEEFEGVQPSGSVEDVSVTPASSSIPSPVRVLQSSSPPASRPSLFSSEKKSSSSSPSKSLSFPSSDKPFFNLVKSLSSDIEPREGASSSSSSSSSSISSSSIRHRHIMKNLVKSLSSDTNQDSSSSYRLPDPRLNLQLFKQFTQSRMPGAAISSAGDSKTAPSSPLTSPDTRSFFKVSEVEARIEDTKRRLSEVIYEPLQQLSKIMDEKRSGVASGSIYRPKALSSSTSELTNMASLNNGHLESNNNSYCIKEEEGGDCGAQSTATKRECPSPLSGSSKSPSRSLLGSMSLEKCSMSALAKQDDEEFCILYSEDFDTCTETDGGGKSDSTGSGSQTKVPPSCGSECCSECELGSEEASVPHYTLVVLTALVYCYFVLPWPTYIGGMLLGVGLGFLLAIGVVWLAGPKPSGSGLRHGRHHGDRWNTSRLDIKEPDVFKGWMNEIGNYDPETYHATLTHSVFVRLEGSVLRLSKPNRNIPRRAVHNEPKQDVTYISQKIYDLTDSKITLVPSNLARKRVWNKKYPICIELGKQDDFMSKAEGDPSEPGSDRTATTTEDRADGPSGARRDLTLYLFGRTGREKEEWFRRILLATKPKTEMKRAASATENKNALSSHSRSSSRSSLDELFASLAKTKDPSGGSTKPKSLLDYGAFMASLVPTQAGSPNAASPVLGSPQSSPGLGKRHSSSPTPRPREEEESVAWLNALLGRVFWDFLGEPHWADAVSKKIQMKLSKIRLPYFMNELTLTELDMGMATPRILAASKPSVDHQGLWFDLELSYSGSFLMTLETKMNLIRLGKEGEALREGEPGKDGFRPRSYCLADSDEESSSAGSSDEEDTSEVTSDTPGAESLVGGHKSSKIMRFVDKIAKSKYFQKATETEFIKKKMEEVSNTPLLLTVEVQELRGTLAVNVPPPPTDRIWYGFRTPPHLVLKARPKLGEREVTLVHVTDWIEKKLDQEFQKVFVMPNMDDVWLTIMHSAMDPRTAGGPLAGTSDGTTADPEPPPQEQGANSQQ